MSGVPVTINSLPGIATVTSADQVPAWDADVGITGKFTLAGLATLYAALTGANFTGNVDLTSASGAGRIRAVRIDNGASWGAHLSAGGNSNASTPSAGFIEMILSGGAARYMWTDNTGTVRINTSPPTSASDTAGTAVGAQTSAWDTKDVYGDTPPELAEVLEGIALGAAAVRRFRYKPIMGYDSEGNEIEGDRPAGGQLFSGVVLGIPDGPDAGRYGTDIDDTHPQGRSLNTVTILGDLLVAVNDLVARVAALEAA